MNLAQLIYMQGRERRKAMTCIVGAWIVRERKRYATGERVAVSGADWRLRG